MMDNKLPFPPLPSKGYPWLNRLRGYIHAFILIPISHYYCRLRGEELPPGIFPLPFNLILKFTLGTREEEGLAMSLARSVGIPVPRFIEYGDHCGRVPWGSILMTRIPGKPLSEVMDNLSRQELETIKSELTDILKRMRSYSNPWGSRVCGVDGNDVYGSRMPSRHISACANEPMFLKSLLRFALVNDSEEDRIRLQMARKLTSLPHDIVFTHGDLWDHNIMVNDGHISGMIDWEWSGWLPEYWEFTSIMQWRSSPWSQQLATLPCYKYYRELEWDLALIELTDFSL
ncbi:kinase-like protein [Guyanagaster necrorhizus]|uniref:Kinase-like protein n=1 Tax=Guyanagaster necrorhizus TaxID=856835 RepID=A0A9P8AQR4_9AGAR|nr:kinase-like protein [Guyanagaster necrorhizus MCA 3950]KAG7444618.1 kinase-like protein [Guyanagaster necrorhizus MCA 3950]